MKPTKIYAEALEEKALEQFNSAMEQEFVVQGALMPDAHTGYSLPIGTAIATKGVVVPAWVGYDIGCGMCAVKTTYKESEIRTDSESIFNSIYRGLPVGFTHSKVDADWDYSDIPMTPDMSTIFEKNGLKQLGSLGGGNHFVEIGVDPESFIWIIVHSGSRGIGHACASHYMRLASGTNKAKEGHFALSVDSQEGKDYITDLNFCLQFALENRKRIIDKVIKEISYYCDGGIDPSFEMINRNHNHAELKDGLWIHRKGATHAEDGMMGVIPGNMRDGSFIVKGKGNPDSLYSSSHGAGRIMSRTAAEKNVTLESFTDTMVGIKAKVSESTKDESPFAYKNIFDVMKQQSDLVEVITLVKPIINIKG